MWLGVFCVLVGEMVRVEWGFICSAERCVCSGCGHPLKVHTGAVLSGGEYRWIKIWYVFVKGAWIGEKNEVCVLTFW
jgi:hypothetical protein